MCIVFRFDVIRVFRRSMYDMIYDVSWCDDCAFTGWYELFLVLNLMGIVDIGEF